MKTKAGEKKYIGFFGICGLVLFYISFLPYLLLIWSAVMGTDTFFGGDSFNRIEYGFRAVAYMGLLLSVMIPVIPCCLLYQILFGSLYISRSSRDIKRPALIYSVIFASLILIPCLVYSGREYVFYLKSAPEIRAVLSGKYGESVGNDCKIRLRDMTDEEFDVYSPVLSKGQAITVSRDRDGGFDDHSNLIRAIANENEGFDEALNSYLDEKYGLPANMHIDARCTSLDLSDFTYGDDYSVLIPAAEYMVDRLYIEVEDPSQEMLEKILTDIWNEQCPKFRDYLGDSLVIIVSADGQAIANMQITMPIPANHNLPVGSIGVLDAGMVQYGLKDEAFYI